jgi:hypothetical protein
MINSRICDKIQPSGIVREKKLKVNRKQITSEVNNSLAGKQKEKD